MCSRVDVEIGGTSGVSFIQIRALENFAKSTSSMELFSKDLDRPCMQAQGYAELILEKRLIKTKPHDSMRTRKVDE